MELKQLEYFIRVAELGSFTRASIVLNIAQPALSRQVRLLEVELHQNLLIRNGRGVTTTEAGKVLLEHGRGILHQVERTKEELSRVRGALSGRVVLGLPPSLLRMLAVPLMREFRTHLPNAALSISEGLSMTMHESLISGRLDVALLYNIVPSPDVENFPLLEEELFLIKRKQEGVPPAPVSLREVVDIPLVIPSRPNSIRMLVESEMANLGCRPKIALEIDGVSAILELVADGEGSAILTRNAIVSSGKPEAYSLHPIVKPSLRSRLVMAVSLRHPATLTQQFLMDLIRNNIDKWLGSR